MHRENGHAIEWGNGDKEWYYKGKQHREDGPAIEGLNGAKFWYLNGISFPNEKTYKKEIRRRKLEALGI